MLTLPTFQFEKELWEQGYDLVIGVDEVGRGSFAGPVVASAVALVTCRTSSTSRTGRKGNSTFTTFPTLSTFESLGINDSKRLKPNEREKAAVWIKENCLAYGIGEVGVATINKVGIGKATAQAMRLAIKNLELRIKNYGPKQKFILVDGFHVKYIKGLGLKNQKAILKGDQKSISIAAASIIAKVYRDSLMTRLSKQYKAYRWGRNKGYGTKEHQEAIRKNGITNLHRIAFVETFLYRKFSTL